MHRSREMWRAPVRAPVGGTLKGTARAAARAVVRSAADSPAWPPGARAITLLFIALFLLLGQFPASGAAQEAAEDGPSREAGLHRLEAALGLAEIADVLHEEAVDYARRIDADLLDGRGGAGWVELVERLHDRERMVESLHAALAQALADAPVLQMVAFFESETGRRIVEREVAARRALLDGAVEEAARDAARRLETSRPRRFALLRRFIEVNDLVEANVVAALNANLAFSAALATALGGDESSADALLGDIWAQEPAVREETEAWLMAFCALAYSDLSDAELDAYIAFSESLAGRRLNRALMTAFEALFVDLSRALGLAAGRVLSGREL